MQTRNRPQADRVLTRLKRKSLSPVEALEELGVYRLGARIHELRRQGHQIKMIWEAHNGGRHGRYFLNRTSNRNA